MSDVKASGATFAGLRFRSDKGALFYTLDSRTDGDAAGFAHFLDAQPPALAGFRISTRAEVERYCQVRFVLSRPDTEALLAEEAWLASFPGKHLPPPDGKLVRRSHRHTYLLLDEQEQAVLETLIPLKVQTEAQTGPETTPFYTTRVPVRFKTLGVKEDHSGEGYPILAAMEVAGARHLTHVEDVVCVGSRIQAKKEHYTLRPRRMDPMCKGLPDGPVEMTIRYCGSEHRKHTSIVASCPAEQGPIIVMVHIVQNPLSGRWHLRSDFLDVVPPGVGATRQVTCTFQELFDQAQQIFDVPDPRAPQARYDLWNYNCCTFSDQLYQAMCGGDGFRPLGRDNRLFLRSLICADAETLGKQFDAAGTVAEFLAVAGRPGTEPESRH